MSKKSRIFEANLLAEQRYLSKKFISEDENPQTSQPQTTEDLTNMGINVNDTATQQSIVQQLQPYKDKVNLGELEKNVGNQNFFTELTKYVKLQPKSIDNYGATIKVGNLTLNGNFNVKEKEVGNIGATYNTNIGKTPTSLMVKTDLGSNTVTGGIKVNIPHNKNKTQGYRL